MRIFLSFLLTAFCLSANAGTVYRDRFVPGSVCMVEFGAETFRLRQPQQYWDAFIEEWQNEVGVKEEVVNVLGGVKKLKAVFLRAAKKIA